MPSIETVVQDGDIKHGTAHAGSSCAQVELPNWIVDGIPAVKLHEESFHMQISMPLAAQNVFTPDVEAKSCEGWDCEGGRRLVPDLSGGDDPDDCFSRIPYEKGFYFLFYLQARPPPLIPPPPPPPPCHSHSRLYGHHRVRRRRSPCISRVCCVTGRALPT